MTNIYLFRFVLHLPLLYPDGQPIEASKIEGMLGDIQEQFPGYTKSPHLGPPGFEGFYRGPDGKIYHEKVYVIYIDTPDTARVINFFQDFKRKYEDVFEQSELYIIYYRVTKVE